MRKAKNFSCEKLDGKRDRQMQRAENRLQPGGEDRAVGVESKESKGWRNEKRIKIEGRTQRMESDGHPGVIP